MLRMNLMKQQTDINRLVQVNEELTLKIRETVKSNAFCRITKWETLNLIEILTN